MHLRRLTPCLALVGLVASSSYSAGAEATVVVRSSLEQMTAGADVIARVVVTDQRVVKDRSRLLTYTSLEVKEAIKGTTIGAVLEVFQVGGTLDGKSAWIVGAHRFQRGEDLVFFGLRHPRGTNLYVPWGIGVGLFAVQTDVSGAEVVELIGDVALVERGTGGKLEPVQAQPRRYGSVDAFRAALRRILDGQTLPEPAMKSKLGPAPRGLSPRMPAPPPVSEGGAATEVTPVDAPKGR